MSIETVWGYTIDGGHTLGEGLHYPKSYPLAANPTATTYDVVGGGAAQTVNPVFSSGIFCALDERGAVKPYWHGRVATADVFYGRFGLCMLNPHAKGIYVKTLRMGTGNEPETVQVPPYVDFTNSGLAEPTDYWTVDVDGAEVWDGVGINLRVGLVSGVPIEKGTAAELRSLQPVYGVDTLRLTVDPADVVETHKVGYLVQPVGIHAESGLERWTVMLIDDPGDLPAVPIT